MKNSNLINRIIILIIWLAGLGLFSVVLVTGCSSGAKKESSNDGSEKSSSGSESNDRNESASGRSGEESSSGEAKKTPREDYRDLKQALVEGNSAQVEKIAGVYLSEDKGDVKTLNALALFHQSKGRMGLARMILKSIVDKNPKNPAALNNLGVVYQIENEDKKAIEFFRKALAIEPNFGPANANLGLYFAKAKDYAKAKPHLEKAYESGVKDQPLLNSYAATLLAQDRSAAGAIVTEAFEHDEKNFEAMWNRVIYLIEIKKDFKAGQDGLDRLVISGVPTEKQEAFKRLETAVSSANKSDLKTP